MMRQNRIFAVAFCILVVAGGFQSSIYMVTPAHERSDVVLAFTSSENSRSLPYTNETNGTIGLNLVNHQNVNVPKNGTVVSASLNISTNGTMNPRDVSLDIGNDSTCEWKYSGTGYGNFGQQTELNTNMSGATYNFSSPATGTVSFYLPKNASISSANATISGAPMNTNLTHFDTSTNDFIEGTMINTTAGSNNLYLTTTSSSWNQSLESEFATGIPTNVALNNPSGDIKLANKTDWYSPQWMYRRPLYVRNNVATTLTYYQTKIVINTQVLVALAQMRADCYDIRFTDSDGVTELSYWFESGRNSANTIVWVKIPSLIASSVTTIFMYYGNPGASTNVSNAANTFFLYDNFEGTDTWTYTETNNDYTHALSTTTSKSPTHSHHLYFSNDNTPANNYGEISKSITLPDTGQIRVCINYYSTNEYGTGIVDKRVLVDSTQLWSEDTYLNGYQWRYNDWAHTPASTTVVLRLRLFNTYDGANGVYYGYGCYWDDVVVRKYASTEPSITNGTPEGIYRPNGEFRSVVSGNVTDAAVSFSTITWDYSNEFGVTYANVSTRTGNTLTPDDGTWSAWTQYATPGSAIADANAKYIQYRVIFASVNTTKTASIFSVEIRFSRYVLEGKYISSNTTVSAPSAIISAKLTWSATTGLGCGVNASLSNDGGSTWYAAPAGMAVVFPFNGTSLRYNLNLSSDGCTNPIVQSVTVEYTVRSEPYNVTLDVGGEGTIFNMTNGALGANRTINITADVVGALASPSMTFMDTYGNDMAVLTMSISTETAGMLSLVKFSIQYNVTMAVHSFPLQNAMQAYVDTHQGMSFVGTGGLELIAVPFTFASSASGSIKYDLSFMCDMPPINNATPPTIYMFEDVNLPNALDLSNYFDDDFDDGSLVYNVTYQANASLVNASIIGHMLSLETELPNWYGTTNITVSAMDRWNKTAFSNITIVVAPVNDAPVIMPAGPFWSYFGVPIFVNFSSLVYDVDNVTSDLRLYTDVPGEANVSGLGITFNFSTPGNHTARVYVSDGIAFSFIEVNFTIVVNHPPEFIPFDDITIMSNENATVALLDHIIEPEGENVSFNISVSGASGLFAASLNGTNLTIIPEECANGTANVTIFATDTFGNLVNQSFSVTVICACNFGPTFLGPVNDTTMLSNATYVLNLSALATDPEGDTLTWNVTGGNENATAEIVGGELVITPSPCANGTVQFTLNVTDGNGNYAEVTFNVTILDNCNYPPLIYGLYNFTMLSNETRTFILAAHGSDPNGDTLTWNITADNSIVTLSIVGGTLIVAAMPCSEGASNITFVLSDGVYNVSKTIIATIINACHPPVITPLSDVVLLSNQTRMIDLALYGSDPDGDALSWSAFECSDVSNAFNITLAGTSLTITPGNCAEGTGVISVSLTDGVYTVNTSFNVTIFSACIPMNHPPIIVGLGVIELYSNETYTLDLSAYGQDIDGDALSWSASESSALFNITLIGSNVTIYPSECANGTDYIALNLSDGELYANASLQVIIHSNCTLPNHPPQISEFLDVCIMSNETMTIPLSTHGYDPDGDALSWSVNGSNAIFNVTIIDGNLTIVPFEYANGTGLVCVTLSDGLESVSSTFEVTVLSNYSGANLPPIISGLTDISMLSNETELIELMLHGSDPDDDNITWTVTENSPLINITFSGGNLTIYPCECASGTAFVSFRLTDEHGAFRTAQIAVVITSACSKPNTPPTIRPGLDVVNITTNNTVSIDLSPYAFDEEGSALTWSVAGGNSSLFQAAVSGDLLNLISVPCANGSAFITLTLSDGELTTTKDVLVNVAIQCPFTHIPPSIKPIANQTLEGNVVITVSLMEYELPGTDMHPTWSVVEYDTSAINLTYDASSSNLAIARLSNASATSVVRVKLEDSLGYFATASFTVVVKEIEGSPVTPKPSSMQENNAFCLILGILALVAALVVVGYLISRRKTVVQVTTIDTEPAQTSQMMVKPAEPTPAAPPVQSPAPMSPVIPKHVAKRPKVVSSTPVAQKAAEAIASEKPADDVKGLEVPVASEAVPVAETHEAVPVAASPTDGAMPVASEAVPAANELAIAATPAVAEAIAVAAESDDNNVKKASVARPVAAAVVVETNEEVAVAKSVYSSKAMKGKKGKNVEALRREYGELELKVMKMTKVGAQKEMCENALRLAGTYAKAGNFEKAIGLLKKVEGK